MTQDTDRELLEFAAKAAGYEWRHYATQFGAVFQININDLWTTWNPLTDDGDALRLAVKLGLTINPYKRGLFVSRDEGEPVIRIAWEESESDVQITRCAIVRAAAEIGKAMNA